MLVPHHDGSDLYVSNSAPQLGEKVTLRVRVPHNYTFDHAVLRYHDDGEPRTAHLSQQSSNDVESWWSVDVVVANRHMPYRFLFSGYKKYDWLNAEGLHDYNVHSNGDFQLIARPSYPKWLNSSVFYQIFPDRFATSGTKELPDWAVHADWAQTAISSEELGSLDLCGGDLLGVEQKLDYLNDLGINGIYFTPVFPALSNHRYDASSFDHVDPILGGDEAWFSLRKAADSMGIRLVGDLTTNHCGVGHDWFKLALDDPSSDEHGFFYWTDKFECGYESWWGHKSLPKFNFSSHELRKRLYEGQNSVIRKWVTEPYGMSGWRIDVGNMTGRLGEINLHDKVMHGVRRAMDEVAPDAWLVAENGDFVAYDLAGAGWHGTMNYQGFMQPLTSWMNRNAKLSGGFQGLPVDAPMITGAQFVRTVRAFSGAMPWRAMVASMILLDSHDTPRYRTIVAGDRHRHLASMTMLLTFVGVPSIYMGDEIGLEGTGGHDARRTINWDDRSAWDFDFLESVKKLVSLRRNEPALTHGGLRWIAAEENYVAYLRETADEAILVMIASDACDVDIDLAPYGYEVSETLFGEAASGSRILVKLSEAGQGIWRLK